MLRRLLPSTVAHHTAVIGLGSVRFATTTWFTKSDEWIQVDDATKIGTVGVTRAEVTFARSWEPRLVGIMPIGTAVEAGDDIASIFGKWGVMYDIYHTPAPGVIVEVNNAVLDEPSLVTDHPEDKGWLVKLDLSKSDFTPAKLNMLTREEYDKFTEERKEAREQKDQVQPATTTWFTKSHEWIQVDDATKIGTVGVTQTFVRKICDQPLCIYFRPRGPASWRPGTVVEAGDFLADLESFAYGSFAVKAPAPGVVVEVNKPVMEDPVRREHLYLENSRLVKCYAEDKGWLVKLDLSESDFTPAKLNLLTREEYDKFTEEREERKQHPVEQQ